MSKNREQYAVGIGFPCGDLIPYKTTMSLARTVHFLATHGVPVNIHTVHGSSAVTIARDVVIGNFMESKEHYLFWIDSDISWTPEDFVKILRLSKELGIACAAYPLKRDSSDVIINFVDDKPEPNKFGCIEITGTGLGFTCIQRNIIEEFLNTKEKMYHPGNNCMLWDAFRFDTTTGQDGTKQTRGEDGAFFADLRALGHKVWLDPSINLGHVGTKEYKVDMLEVIKPNPLILNPLAGMSPD